MVRVWGFLFERAFFMTSLTELYGSGEFALDPKVTTKTV